MKKNVKITKLLLSNFRNFSSKKIDCNSDMILLCGANGVGKTNILESITLLGRSNSLRGCDFEEMIMIDSNSANPNQISNQFAIYAEISDHDFIDRMGISFDRIQKKKMMQINDQPLGNKQQDSRNNLINFIWLTPELESLFILGKSERRDYMDRIVCDIDLQHNTRVNNYQKALRERLLILQKYSSNLQLADKWLNAIEKEIVELAVAIAFARIEAINFFNRAIDSFVSNFPKTKLQIIGDIEQKIIEQNHQDSFSALALETFYREKLIANRLLDLQNFKTHFGVHRSDFDALFVSKNMLATKSSTGEQKSIMLSITLARAKISALYKNQPTILLFDEVASHLDDQRKEQLFAEIAATQLQTFFSTTKQELVPAIEGALLITN